MALDTQPERAAIDTRAHRIRAVDEYLAARTGCYEWRCVRYDAALEAMHRIGLDDRCTVMDVGSGWGEFGVRLHAGKGGTNRPVCAVGEPDPCGKPIIRRLGAWDCPTHRDRAQVRWLAELPSSRARYIPIDAGNDGTDLNDWTPPRDVDYIVALEVAEHLAHPSAFLNRCCLAARRAVIVSTPNPATVDVLGMDQTHVSIVGESRLTALGFKVEARSFYGQEADSLFAVWTP